MIPEPIQPEDLRPDQLSLVPDLPTERTATALLSLQAGVASVLELPEGRLVNLRGVLLDEGSVALYGLLVRPSSRDYIGYVAGWHKAGDRGVNAVLYGTEREASAQYDATVAYLSA